MNNGNEFLQKNQLSTEKQHDDTETFLAALAGGLSDDFPDQINNDDVSCDTPRASVD